MTLWQVLPNTVIDVWKKGWEDEMKRVTASGLHAILSTCWYLNDISYGADWTKVSRISISKPSLAQILTPWS